MYSLGGHLQKICKPVVVPFTLGDQSRDPAYVLMEPLGILSAR